MLSYFGKFATRRTASYVETVLIALTLFCLPLFEAPKNIFSIFFLLTWVFVFLRTKSLGLYCGFNWPIWGLIIVLWVAPFFSVYGDDITAFNSAPRWTLLGLFVIMASRLDYSRAQLMLVWTALMAGGALAVVESLWIWRLYDNLYPEFRSVGHVNHSSMYTLVTLASGLGALYTRIMWLQVLGLLAVISTLVFLPPSRSLVGAATITAVVIVAFSVWALRRWSLRGLIFSTFAGFALVFVLLMTPPASGFRAELTSRVTGDDFFSGRDKILNSALSVWDQHPILGTGWFSFGTATSEATVRAALEADGIDYDPDIYWHYPHGHNLWTTMLIERGLVGVVLVTLLLLFYFKNFFWIVFRPDPIETIDRGVAVGALLVAVGFAVAGLGNTTMMNEHGHAGMLFIGVAYGYLRAKGLVSSKL